MAIFYFREIYEVFSGEFTKLDIFSDCLCPASHPRALVDTAGLDLYCSLNEDENNRVRRDNPPQGRAPFTTNAGLYIPQFLTDGGALPFEGSAIPVGIPCIIERQWHNIWGLLLFR